MKLELSGDQVCDVSKRFRGVENLSRIVRDSV